MKIMLIEYTNKMILLHGDTIICQWQVNFKQRGAKLTHVLYEEVKNS